MTQKEMIDILYNGKDGFIKENKQTIFVLLTKTGRFYYTYNANDFYDIICKLSKNNYRVDIDTGHGYTEVWKASCTKKELQEVFWE